MLKQPFYKIFSGTSEPTQSVSISYHRLLIYSIVSLSFIGTAWLFLGKTEQTIQVTGQLVPLGKVRDVQLPNAGVVEQVFVKEGELVSKDQLLLKLESALEESNLTNTIEQISIKESQLNYKRQQKKSTSESYNAQISNASKSLLIEKKKYQVLEDLQKSGAVSQFQLLDQFARVSQLSGELLIVQSQKDLQLSVIDAEIQRLTQELLMLSKQKKEFEQNLRYLNIYSPQAGYVFDLVASSGGYVGTSTEKIMKIVPTDHLVADINIPSAKIGFIARNSKVDISVDAFPSSDFGILTGKIKSVGSSALKPDQEYDYPRYPVEVTLDSQVLNTNAGSSLRLRPGMSITANISLRQASYFQLIFSQFDNSMKSLTQY